MKLNIYYVIQTVVMIILALLALVCQVLVMLDLDSINHAIDNPSLLLAISTYCSVLLLLVSVQRFLGILRRAGYKL